MIIKAYNIGIYAGGHLVAVLPVDATSKKQAYELGREIADEIFPAYKIHYEYLRLGSMNRFSVLISEIPREALSLPARSGVTHFLRTAWWRIAGSPK
jgi:hypothetical protein